METIKFRAEFERVFSNGKRVAHPLVRITVLRGDEGDPGKVAFVAAGNAVYRNRCKRVLREAARACDMPRNGASIILFSTRATHDAKPADVSDALERLLGRAGV